MIIGRSRLPPPPQISHPLQPKISQTPLPRKFLNPPPQNFSTPQKISHPPLAICYPIMHIVHNMRQSPTSAALVVSCVFHIKLF